MNGNRRLSATAWIATLVLATGFGVGSLQAALIDNLDGNWRLDETSGDFEDSSGNGNTLTAEGSPWGNGSNGLIDGAMNPDASDATGDYAHASAGDGEVGDYQISDAFSAQVWVNLESDPTGFQYYLGRGTGDFDGGWRICNNGNTGDGGSGSDSSVARVLFSTGAGAWSQNSSQGVLAAGSGWTQLVFTYDGSEDITNGLNLYVNGVLDNNATDGGTITGSINEDNAAFSIGNRDGDLTNDVDGDLDEVAVWSRELTAQEVSDLYNNGSGMNIPEPTSLALLVPGMTALLGRRRRRR